MDGGVPWWAGGGFALAGVTLTALLTWLRDLSKHRRDSRREQERRREEIEQARRDQLEETRRVAAQEIVELLLQMESLEQQRRAGAWSPTDSPADRHSLIVKAGGRALVLPGACDREHMKRTLALLQHCDLMASSLDCAEVRALCFEYAYDLLGKIMRGEETAELPYELRLCEKKLGAPTDVARLETDHGA